MRKYYSYLLSLLCAGALLLHGTGSYANHLVGMDFHYTYVSGNTYTITLIAYGDCGSAATTSAFGLLSSSTPRIYIYNADTYIDSINLTIVPPTAGVEITPVCPADLLLTQCTDLSYTIPGIKKFVYSGNYTVSGPSTAWRFLFTGEMGGSFAGRALSITNIFSTPDTYIQLIDTLDNSGLHNSNPDLTNIPTPFFCLDYSDNYNPGAVDPDGDSLTFYLVPAQSGTLTDIPGGLVTYYAGFTGADPFGASASTFTLDASTGQITFFPTATQRSLVVYNIEEHRSGVLVGTSQREMTFLVQTCTNTPAFGGLSGASSGVIDDSTHFHICQNSGAFSFDLNPTEADASNDITVTYTGLPTGSSFTVTGNGTPTPHAVFSWTSTGVTPGAYTFYVTYTDNNCPLAGTQTIAYTVTIVAGPTISVSVLSTETCYKKAAISVVPAGGGSPWVVDVSLAGDTVQTFSSVSSTFTDSVSGSGTFVFTIFPVTDHACRNSASVTVTAPAPIALAPTFTNPSYCGDNNGTITLYNLTAGTSDTIKFSLGGVVQPSRVLVASAAGTVTLTGLVAGVYSAITATSGYCVSLTAGPVTLVNPAFTMRALTSVNPVFCGICNGSITLYGLHPGQRDTVNYLFGGVAQPPFSELVGADSEITITGLCPGAYTSFVANTAGACVSNTLGPVTLTVPPFTMRAISFTNPVWCGICNGTVTLYGLHPGSVDTIDYTLDGISQTPVAFTVPADSMVTLTGLCAGTYANFIAHAGSTCVSNTLGPVTLTVPAFTMRTITFTNPDYCGICNGTISLYGLYPGESDTIHYTLGGVAQTPVAFTVPADSMVTLTGLCAGVYANFVAHTGGVCVSNTLGPVTLTVPPFTQRSLSSTNPDYCGICNGTITIYGLHPGESDTVHYTDGGVAQTPVAFTVPADSMVTLTGLCAGVYANIITHTGGVCVSNTLGPVTLTVPPFTMRALTFTNPDYCGICNGTVTLYGLHPGEIDTINFTDDGIPMPAVSHLVPADSMITITGLCAGTYDNFIATTGGVCVSNTLGPAPLTVPPFTMRTFTATNPTKCGFCNGIIKLFGLHPGETDTINYTMNGVAQPQLPFLVPPDSIVIISGLCEGFYANFIATTGGVCVSNALGPDSLIWPPIIPAFTDSVHKGCQGDTVLFTNSSWPASDLTYRWFFGDGDSSTATNPSHVYYIPGTFKVELDITNTKCYDSTNNSVTFDNLITAGFTAMPDSFLCQGSPVTFTNTSSGTLLNYTWIFGDGNTSNATNNVYTYHKTGIYNVVLAVSNFVPCYDTAKTTLAVDSISTVSIISTDSVICGGTGITFTGIYSDQGLRGLIWSFGDGDTMKNVNPVLHVYDGNGTYTVTMSTLYRACPDTSTSRTYHVFGQPNINLGSDTSICPGSNAIELVDEVNGNNPAASWLWSTGETGNKIMVTTPGDYYAIVTINGCSSTDTVVVQNNCYLDIPNAFTPNGDGLNDYFFPRNLLSKGLTSFSMQIYNRWGQLIFETQSLDGRGWDGRFNDVPQPEGVFIYVIDASFLDGQKEHRQGSITLLR